MTSFHDLTVARTLDVLHTSSAGLSSSLAKERRRLSGENVLPSAPPPGWWRILARQFASPLMLILFAAMGVSFAFSDSTDGALILAAIVINVTVGFLQEFKASRALEELRSFLVQTARVRRDGREHMLPARELVPGDVVVLKPGDHVPADARLLSAEDVEADESVLTGESLPVEKHTDPLPTGTALGDRRNLLFSGTVVVRGKVVAVVTATGLQTEIGRIARLVSETKDERSPLQNQFVRLSRFLAGLYVLLALGIFATGLFFGKSVLEMFVLSSALAVAAVPEGLLVAVTVVLALGMRRMLARRALVRRLVATETLGSVSVICTDKTGTLTQASMEVASVVTADADIPAHRLSEGDVLPIMERAIAIGVLCNDASISDSGASSSNRYVGSPTEVAFLKIGEAIGMSVEALRAGSPRLATVPFDSERKFMMTLVETPHGREALAKGAGEVVLRCCRTVTRAGRVEPMSEETRAHLEHVAEVMTERGLRVLACAFKAAPEDQQTLSPEECAGMTFVGFLGLRDPVRSSARDAVERARQAGVRTVIVTGDHPRTAAAVGREIGLKHDHTFGVMTGAEVEALSDAVLRERVADVDVFARVEPVHKVRIVEAWKARGEVVAMVGDGVNDAAALKVADIGVAQGNGTDVTKQVADMVLLDGDLSTIVAAIEEGRVIFDNIRKTTTYLLLNGFAEMMLILLSFFFGLPLPLVAAQILYINFVTDGFPAITLTVDPAEDGVLQERPRPRGMPILTRSVKALVFGVGSVFNLVPFLLFALLVARGAGVEYAQTMMFASVSLVSIFVVFSVRSLRRPLWQTAPWKNRALLVAVAVALLFTVLPVYWHPLQTLLSLVPLAPADWLLLTLVVLAGLLLIELFKWYDSRLRYHSRIQ